MMKTPAPCLCFSILHDKAVRFVYNRAAHNTMIESKKGRTMKNEDPRKRYIEAAAQIIQQQGMKGVSARKIAALTGTVPSALYRHFENVEELAMYAAMRYQLDAYDELDRIAEKAETALDMYVRTERSFARFAFLNPVLFDSLEFGKSSDKLGTILQEYRAIFPEESGANNLYTSHIINSRSFESGNMDLLRLCIADGSLQVPEQLLEELNLILVNLFKGFFKTVLDHPKTDVEAQVDKYIRCFVSILEMYCQKNPKSD